MSTTKASTILVTGGSGFIGSHVCDAFINAGYVVRAMDNLATSKRANLAHLEADPKFSFMEGDIRNEDDCAAVVKGVDVVVHLAALGSVPRSIADPLASHRTNLSGFLNMIEAAWLAGVKRFVYASSSSVYGDSKELPKREENTGLPLSPYAVTKVGNETYARLYARLHGMSTIGLRFFNVFGERQDPEGPYAAAIPKFISAFLRHTPPQIHGDGLQSRDFTYVANAVEAVLKAATTEDQRVDGEVFNVAFGARTTLLELVDALRDELARVDPAIASVGVEHVAERSGDIRDSLADISKAEDLLGYAPAVELRQGLRKAVPWYVANWK
ncbi:MAG: SDR family NAD(P)-dependent oxidoreductase [Flavobacteriales bacterium]